MKITFKRNRSLSPLEANCKYLPVIRRKYAHVNRNTALLQNNVRWPSSTVKEHMTTISPSVTRVKQKPHNRSNGQQRYQSSRLLPASNKPGRAAFGIARPTTLVPASSVSPSPRLMKTNIQVFDGTLVPLLCLPSCLASH